MADAVTAVAGNSFFAVVEPCDAQRFADLSSIARSWWLVSVQFTESAETGVVLCTLTDELATMLFDAFTGRDPDGPPDSASLVDLLGEFGNMICGAWLTRLANHQTFSLSRPAVVLAQDVLPSDEAGARKHLAVNDLPLAVEVRVAPSVYRSVVATEA